MHNLYYYQQLMSELRGAVDAGTLPEFVTALRAAYQ
jgi:queuine/archaeosine tRNA-ribosyltransferase